MLAVRNSIAMLIHIHSIVDMFYWVDVSSPFILSDIRSLAGTMGSWISQRQLANKVLRNCLHFCHLSSAEILSTHYHAWLLHGSWKLNSGLISQLYVFFGENIFKSFAHVFIGLFVLLNCRSSVVCCYLSLID